MDARQVKVQVVKRAWDVVNSCRRPFVIQCGLVADVFRKDVCFTAADGSGEAGHIHKKAEKLIGCTLDQIGVDELMAEHALQDGRKLFHGIERVDDDERLHMLQVAIGVQHGKSRAK